MNQATRKRVLTDFGRALQGWEPDPKWEYLFRRTGPVAQTVGPVSMRGSGYRMTQGLFVWCTPLPVEACGIGGSLNIYRGGGVLKTSFHEDDERIQDLAAALASALTPPANAPLTTSAVRASMRAWLPRSAFHLAFLCAWDKLEEEIK